MFCWHQLQKRKLANREHFSVWSKQVYIFLTKGKEMRAKSVHKAYLGRQTLLIQENFHPVPV